MRRQTVTWLAIVLFVIAAGAGVWLWQRQQNDDEVAELKSRIENLQTRTERLSEAVEETSGPMADADGDGAEIVFDPPGQFNNEVMQEIENNVIAPHELYNSSQDREVAAYYVTPSDKPNEYAVTAIFTGGDLAYEGFLIGGDEELSWTPSCQETCEFSDEFLEAYPEIAERAQ